jgi:DNA polymerase-3 subunit gamma/tau
MATQSLYRRYRPRRFSELKGQEHVVRALRNAVVNEREGQAYLFSGPRGTGKTSTARILAKVLNCTQAVDGEPCCECESCLAIERGSSFDVLELDAASNNGVDNVRELIERAVMGNPGRHRVFILDEVHMLSAGAEAALLKTLEEPPPHVVFVLATTDPQKVNETIRSRTQHLQFRLLPSRELEEHVQWVIKDAGLTVTPEAVRQVLEQGGGSARDTLSALELIAAGGGEALDRIRPEDIIDALIDHDPGAALAAVARSVQLGHDPRGIAEGVVRYLREMFLAIMAPDLVQLGEEQAREAADRASRYGAASVVRAIEVLGDALIELRRASDARLVLDVVLVKLASAEASTDMSALLARIERLEAGAPARAKDSTGGIPRPAVATAPSSAPAPKASTTSTAPRAASSTAAPARPTSSARQAPADVTAPTPTTPRATPATDAEMSGLWPRVLGTLRSTTRALYSAIDFSSAEDGVITFDVPSDMHMKKCEENLPQVHQQLQAVTGSDWTVKFRVGSSRRAQSSAPAPRRPARAAVPEPVIEPDEDVEIDESRGSGVDAVLDAITREFPGAQVVDPTES